LPLTRQDRSNQNVMKVVMIEADGVGAIYPTLSERWGRGETPRIPNNQATPQSLDQDQGQNNRTINGAPKRLRCDTSVDKEVSQIAQLMMIAGEARIILIHKFPPPSLGVKVAAFSRMAG